MATVTIKYGFADGDSILAQVEVPESYPDAIDEARAQAVRAFREAMRDGLEASVRDDEDD